MHIRTDPVLNPYSAFLGATQRPGGSPVMPTRIPDARPIESSLAVGELVSLESGLSQAHAATVRLGELARSPEQLAAKTKAVVETTNSVITTLQRAKTVEGPLRDRLVGHLQQSMGQVGYAYAAIGLTFQAGRLALDEDTFRKAYEANPDQVQAVLTGIQQTIRPALERSQESTEVVRLSAASYGSDAQDRARAELDLKRLGEHSQRLTDRLETLKRLQQAQNEQTQAIDRQRASVPSAAALAHAALDPNAAPP